LTVGIAIIVVVAAHWALLVYGASYSANATAPLIVLAAALPIVGLNNFGQTLLKLRGQLTSLVVLNVASFVTIVVLAELWSSAGLTLVAVAWAIGNLVAGLIAVASLLRPARDASPPLAPVPPPAATDRALAMKR
jgi:O-antigen/teichoic acid export membrane protein